MQLAFLETDGPLPLEREETARVKLPLVQVILEAGAGHHTVPLLIAELTVEGNLQSACWRIG